MTDAVSRMFLGRFRLLAIFVISDSAKARLRSVASETRMRLCHLRNR